MSASVLLQDYTTIRGNLTTTQMTQPVNDYADLLLYQDVVAFIEVTDQSGNPNMKLETSPTQDDTLFQNMDAATFVPAVGVTTKIYRYSSATVPLARFMRWKITGSATYPWSVTFRIWLSPNQA